MRELEQPQRENMKSVRKKVLQVLHASGQNKKQINIVFCPKYTSRSAAQKYFLSTTCGKYWTEGILLFSDIRNDRTFSLYKEIMIGAMMSNTAAEMPNPHAELYVIGEFAYHFDLEIVFEFFVLICHFMIDIEWYDMN